MKKLLIFIDIHDGIVFFFPVGREKSDPGYLAGIAAKGIL